MVPKIVKTLYIPYITISYCELIYKMDIYSNNEGRFHTQNFSRMFRRISEISDSDSPYYYLLSILQFSLRICDELIFFIRNMYSYCAQLYRYIYTNIYIYVYVDSD